MHQFTAEEEEGGDADPARPQGRPDGIKQRQSPPVPTPRHEAHLGHQRPQTAAGTEQGAGGKLPAWGGERPLRAKLCFAAGLLLPQLFKCNCGGL